MERLKQTIKEMLEQEPLSSRGLTLAGIGSDKVVFESAGSTRKLIKVSRGELRERVSQLLKGGAASETSTDKEHTDKQKAFIKKEKEDEQEARDIFGEEHFLKRGMFKIKVPITKDFLVAFVGDGSLKAEVDNLPDDFYAEIEMLAETQLIAEELKNPEKYSPLSFSTSLITQNDFRNSNSIEEALSKARAVVDKKVASEEAEKYLENEKYRLVLKEIVSKIISYTKKTGEMIDIFGPNNITLYTKEDGSIDYHVIEALLPGIRAHWSCNINQDKNLGLLRHYYVYYYSVKSIADKLGIAKNLELEDLVYFKGAGIPTGKFPVSEK